MNFFNYRHQLACGIALLAQTSLVCAAGPADTLRMDSTYVGQWNMLSIRQPLLKTENTAALGLLPVASMGTSGAEGLFTNGSFKRPQQASSSQEGQFNTERYQALNHSMWYGRFSYHNQRDRDRQWTDVLDPYRGTPYILADSIGGDWKKQSVDLEVEAATRGLSNNRLYLGMGLLYQVATGAKQLDPRPLNNLNQLNLTPSLLWSWNERQRTGFTAAYAVFQEDINLEIRRQSSSHNLYRFKGLSIHDDAIPISAGYTRHYQGSSWQGEIQHQLEDRSQRNLLTAAAGYTRYRETTRDGTSLPLPAGDYASDRIHGSLSVQHKGRLWQTWDLSGEFWNDQGTEYHTTYNSDQQAYQVTFSGVLYERQWYTASFSYQLLAPSGTDDFHWLLTGGLRYEDDDRSYKYTQPSHQALRTLSYELSFQYNPNRYWRLSLQTLLQTCLSSEISYTPTSGPNTTAKEVLFPDYAYLSANSGAALLQIKRLFHIQGTGRSTWYISGGLDYNRRLNQPEYAAPGQPTRRQIQVGLGAYY